MILIDRGLDQESWLTTERRVLKDKEVTLFSFEGISLRELVIKARRVHPYPYRTRKLSSLASKILSGQLLGKIEHRQYE